MIKYNERFEFERDPYNWILTEWRDSLGKQGQLIRVSRKTYHGTLTQVCKQIIDRSCDTCEDLVDLEYLIRTIHEDLKEAIDVSK